VNARAACGYVARGLGVGFDIAPPSKTLLARPSQERCACMHRGRFWKLAEADEQGTDALGSASALNMNRRVEEGGAAGQP
jgi:hypothetical protein